MTAGKIGVKRPKTAPIKKIEIPLSLSFIEQAEVCRAQARDAARLKRFRAALGLFRTALNLCRHAEKTGETNESRLLAAEKIEQIDLEFATYNEMARSLERAGAIDGRR